MKFNEKLCMGTAQLGMKYGINNVLERQPTNEESFSLLQRAIDAGIGSFDTAAVYGNAEKILGDFGVSRYPVEIISKISLNNNLGEAGDTKERIEESILGSLARLKVKRLDVCLLHIASDLYNKEIMNGLLAAKEKNLIKLIGVSVYEERDAIAALKSGKIDCIQIPYNVLDQRLDATEFFDLAAQNKVKVYARSAFLQGILLMDIDRIPEFLSGIKSSLKKFHGIIDAYGFTRYEAAFLFTYCHPGIDKIIFGAETEGQLINNIETIRKAKEFSECYAALKGSFSGISKNLILPYLWKDGK